MAFVQINSEQLETLEENTASTNTKRVVKRSASLFRRYLEGAGKLTSFENSAKDDLNQHLRLFFASVRTKTGEELKKSSLNSIKYGLSKYLKDSCEIDICDTDFSLCQKTFRAKMSDLKKKGKGCVDHKTEISKQDLKKLSDHGDDNTVFNVETPCGLQKKVWFDITFFLCRRGRENQRTMKNSTFAVATDSTGRDYIHQVVDESDKNHGADSLPDDTVGEARMYARPGDPKCPVLNFQKYVGKLHPDIEDLWQRPLDSFESESATWYCKVPLGKNTLGKMMSEISKIGQLSTHYTNHCIRSTSIAALDRAGYEARHIIRASGHKSEASIRSYSRRLTEEKKRDMSDSLSSAFGCEDRMCETRHRVLPELNMTEQEIMDVFNDENVFLEVQNENNPPCSMSNDQQVNSVAPGVVSAHSMHSKNCAVGPTSATTHQPLSVANTYSSYLPSTLNKNFVINPNITNSAVHFHLYGQPGPQ